MVPLPLEPQGGGDAALALTGERTVPGVAHENYWFQRHVAAYAFAARRRSGLRVLDAGCGEGYGTALLAREGSEGGHGSAGVVGVDLVADVVAHARAAYPGIAFLAEDVCALSLPDTSFDAVVSLQVIEHLPDVPRFLGEVARVLRPGGTFVCATPNRLTFSPGLDVPLNPFHEREYSPAELVATLSPRFHVAELHGLAHGPRLRAVEVLTRRRFGDLTLEHPPGRRPAWLTRTVAAVRPWDFPIRRGGLEASLDLVAVASPRT